MEKSDELVFVLLRGGEVKAVTRHEEDVERWMTCGPEYDYKTVKLRT